MSELELQTILHKAKVPESQNYVLSLHHALMKGYGCWIPFEEFKKLYIPTVVNLIDKLNEDYEREKAEREKRKKK